MGQPVDARGDAVRREPPVVPDRAPPTPAGGPSGVATMKRSRNERAQRARETERMREIEAAWYASIPRDTAVAFAQEVDAARARGPLPPPPDMAPGTAPNPPR